ncbi:MAG: hypothetical protein LAO56_02980 [Acidobacteriia bacterium]|nr:hypothetical protein [Terriglobia bacterium]
MTLSKATLLFAVLAFSMLAFGQPANQPQAGTEAPAITACSFQYSSGPLATFTRYCLSANGNIVQFDSPSGFEYINNGGPVEGYGFCDVTPNVSYYDYASIDSGNWGATTVTIPNATTAKFVRTTGDGIWQLTETVVQIKAGAMGPGSVKITMALKNLSTISRNVALLRVANVNAGPVAINDEFVSSFNSAFGQEPGASWGLGLTTNTFTFAHNGTVFSVPTGPDPCHYVTFINNFAFVGDGSLGHVYAITVPKGATKTVTMTYKPI